MVRAGLPALVLAPMDGITDAPMRALQGECGAFAFAVSEFIRVSAQSVPEKVFAREVPELATGAKTSTGLKVQVQLLGGDPDRMAQSAIAACAAGAQSIDLNFGCPAPTVNRHDGGASLLNEPLRIRAIVREVRSAVSVPVSAKLRLGWDEISAIHKNSAMAAEGGASWLTIHARTRMQNYSPPVQWKPIGEVARNLGIPIVANGDIWSLDDFRRCRDETGCCHFMLGRCALADPSLPQAIAVELGLTPNPPASVEWTPLLRRFAHYCAAHQDRISRRTLHRLKQWLKIAASYGSFDGFEVVKRAASVEEFFELLACVCQDKAA